MPVNLNDCMMTIYQPHSTNQLQHLHQHSEKQILYNNTLVEDSIKLNYKRVVLLSKDTDVPVLVLHYMKYINCIRLVELWMQLGTGQNKRLYLYINY